MQIRPTIWIVLSQRTGILIKPSNYSSYVSLIPKGTYVKFKFSDKLSGIKSATLDGESNKLDIHF